MSYVKPKKSQKRKRGREPMIDGDIDAAKVVTHTKVSVTNDDGSVSAKQVLESLDDPRKGNNDSKPLEPDEIPQMDYDMDSQSPPPPKTKSYRVRH